MVKMNINLTARHKVPSMSIKQPQSGCFMRHTSQTDLASKSLVYTDIYSQLHSVIVRHVSDYLQFHVNEFHEIEFHEIGLLVSIRLLGCFPINMKSICR